MRTKAGTLITTLLLLALPALANAWTLTVKVAGGSETNNVTVAYGSPPVQKTFKSTVSYLYPTGAITVTDNAPTAQAGTVTIDGVAYNAATFVSPTSGNHTLQVSYAVTTPSSGLGITQNDGGTVYAQNRNSTWSSTGVTGLLAGASVPVTIAADANHKILDYTLNGTDYITTALNGQAGQVLSTSTLANSQQVKAHFAVVGKISASLFAPTNGTSGKAVNTSVTATSNAGNLQYAFAVTGPAGFSQSGSGSQAFSFTPTAAGTYTITAQVTSDGAGSTTASANVVVADAQVVANAGCVSCHSTQPALHAITGVQDACGGCHGATPHEVAVATHSGAQETNCANCHASSVATVSASIHLTMPSTKLSCANCHTSGPTPTISSAPCTTCHATVNNHTAATMGTKGCLDCHDGHNPSSAAPLLGSAGSHPAVTLYTFEELGMQMGGAGARIPVQVDASGKGMPYSPKQTCGTSGCHVKNGVDYTYDKISDHAFHSNQGRSEYQDSATGMFDATKNKPWVQSTAMVGKW